MAENAWTAEHVAKLTAKVRQTAPPAAQDGSQAIQAPKAGKSAPKQPQRRFDPFLALLNAAGLPAPELEYVFHPIRRFKADYAWPVEKLIIERQGGVWAKDGTRAKKAHTEPLAILRDYEKANLAQLAGYTYLQFTPDQLDSGSVIETLKIRLGEQQQRPAEDERRAHPRQESEPEV